MNKNLSYVIAALALLTISCSSSLNNNSLYSSSNSVSTDQTIIFSSSSQLSNSDDKIDLTISDLLPRCFNKANISTSITKNFYTVIGNGIYVQETSVFKNNNDSLYQSLKGLKVNKEKEDFSSLYGGSMITYSFDDQTIKFFNNYLLIEEANNSYRGDFYSGIKLGNLSSFQADEQYLSLHIDNGSLRASNQLKSQNSISLRELLSSIHFKKYSGEESFSDELSEISLSNYTGVHVFSDKVFSVGQSEILYEIENDFSFPVA